MRQLLKWLWGLHKAIVQGEPYTALWTWIREHWREIAAVLGISGVGTLFASGIDAINRLGWGAWPFAGALFGLIISLAFLILAKGRVVWRATSQSERVNERRAGHTGQKPLAPPTQSLDADTARTLTNIDRFLNEYFLPAHTSLREGVTDSSLKLLGKGYVDTALFMMLMRDHDLITSAITKARYSQPQVEAIIDLIDVCFDHYLLVQSEITRRRGGFSPEEMARYDKIRKEGRKLFFGMRWLLAATPSLNGIGKMYHMTEPTIQSLLSER